uniref:Uncharacterized protein n=1 Tax=Anguilla anguilla TaxID=7936 RepID=A0A0E9SD13_ANGAN
MMCLLCATPIVFIPSTALCLKRAAGSLFKNCGPGHVQMFPRSDAWRVAQ